MLKNMDPPLGFGSKCPDRLAFKKLIRMNQPIDDEGMVHFTTTLFALIRENLSIKMRAAEEMDQADFELRQTIIKVWPYEGKEKIDLLVPPREGRVKSFPSRTHDDAAFYYRNWKGSTHSRKNLWRPTHSGELEGHQIRQNGHVRHAGKQAFYMHL